MKINKPSLFFVFILLLNIYNCKNPGEYKPKDELVPPPEPPQLLHPLPDTIYLGNKVSVYFEWTEVKDAQIYEIQVDTTDGFAFGSTINYSQEDGTTLSISLTRYSDAAVFYGRVMAGNSSWTNYTDWSEARRFYIYPEGP